MYVLLATLLLAVTPSLAAAADVRVAAAANVAEPAREIARAFATGTGHTVRVSTASTGQLFAQITQGAPFDVFLAADQARPRQAVLEGLAVPGSRFTYARGTLVLYSRSPDLATGPSALEDTRVTRLAIANPETAPYGVAAIQVLEALGVLERMRDRMVRGANIAQTYQFVATGNAELGFVAAAQVATVTDGSLWPVPDSLHAPIAQDAVLLATAADREAAKGFLDFLAGPRGRAVLESYGYGPGG